MCGLIAHADGHLDDAECDRLIALAQGALGDNAYSEWLGLMVDPDALRAVALDNKPDSPQRAEALLEEAWSMASVDGTRSPEELGQLAAIAESVGIPTARLTSLRGDWAKHEQRYADVAADSIGLVLAGNEPLCAQDLGTLQQAVTRLPVGSAHREELLALANLRGRRGRIEENLMSLPQRARARLIRFLGPVVIDALDPSSARARFLALATRLGSRERAELILAQID